jgi:hypothetical protein
LCAFQQRQAQAAARRTPLVHARAHSPPPHTHNTHTTHTQHTPSSTPRNANTSTHTLWQCLQQRLLLGFLLPPLRLARLPVVAVIIVLRGRGGGAVVAWVVECGKQRGVADGRRCPAPCHRRQHSTHDTGPGCVACCCAGCVLACARSVDAQGVPELPCNPLAGGTQHARAWHQRLRRLLCSPPLGCHICCAWGLRSWSKTCRGSTGA